jgi:hypothetical protein
MPVTVTKNQLENYLRVFLRTYRSQIKKEYPGYFNEFPFYGPVKVIGVITPNKVYVIFTKDDDPKRTTFEVIDETDMPELLRVKDAIYSKDEDIFALLGIKTLLWDLSGVNEDYSMRKSGNTKWFDEKSASRAALYSIRFHYERLFDHKGEVTRVTKLSRGKYKPTISSKYGFVYNSIDERSLRTKVEEIFDRAEEGEEILITGWIGSFAIRLIRSLKKRNVTLRIITHKPTPPQKGKTASDEYDIFRKVLAKEFSDNVRLLGKLHARLIVSEKEALVSTADLTKDSHEGKFEAGISTTDGLTIKKIKDYFEKMWEISEPLKT